MQNKQQQQTQILETCFDYYLSECEFTKQLRPQTLKSYRDVFETFSRVMPELKQVSDLRIYTFHEFFKRLSTRKRKIGQQYKTTGVKPSTIRTYYNKLIAFFHWLEDKNYLQEGFCKKITKPPKPKYDDDKALDSEEISRIISAITIHTVKDDFLNIRDLVMIQILLYTGIRKGELLGLQITDIHFDQRQLQIRAETSKSKRNRKIPLHTNLLILLRKYLNQRKQLNYKTPFLICSSKSDSKLSVHGLKHWVEKYKRLSGVKFHIHQFRHTFACSLAKTNADIISIMRVLGHTTTAMTQRYLRSIKIEESRSYIDALSY
ncbi:MAG: tyrosine-type recombinase/integrase [Flavobacteriales bacterium]